MHGIARQICAGTTRGCNKHRPDRTYVISKDLKNLSCIIQEYMSFFSLRMLENGVKGLRMGQIINCLTGFDLENGVEELDILGGRP